MRLNKLKRYVLMSAIQAHESEGNFYFFDHNNDSEFSFDELKKAQSALYEELCSGND